MSSFESNTKNIIVKPRKKRSLKTTNGIDALPEILKQELTSAAETKKTSLRLRKNHNNNTTTNNSDDNHKQTERVHKRSIRASSKAIVQRTEQNQSDDLLEQATVAQTVDDSSVEETVKKPRRKRKLKPQNNIIPNSTLLSGDELALGGVNDSGLSLYLNTSSSQPTPVTLGTPRKKRRMTSKFRTPSPPPPSSSSRSQSPPSTPSRLALASVLSDLDLSQHTILPDLSYIAHMHDSREQTDTEYNDDENDNYNEEVQNLLFESFQVELEAGSESDASSVYYDAMSDIEDNEKTL